MSVTFATGGAQAFVVTQDGATVVSLPSAGAGSVGVVRNVALTEDPTEDADTRDVSVTADGRAVVRREGSADVRIVNLATGAAGVVTLSGPVTDLDVTSDGARAIAVVRQTAEVAILPLATAASDASTVLRETVDGEVIGSAVLTGDGKQAVLYSNAATSERLIVLDTTSGMYRIVRVHALVLSVLLTPDGQFAVVLHRQAPPVPDGGVTVADGGAIDGAAADAAATSTADAGTTAVVPVIANAFSVIPLDGTRAGRIQETTAAPNAVALAPGSDRALVTVSDTRAKAYGAYVVGIPALDVTALSLASPPIASGVVAAANRGYVAQSHPEGRITFIPFAGGPPQTLTGFDLGARVVDGVTP